MRLSVITGVLACTLVFGLTSGKTEAASINKLTINDSGVQLALLSEQKEIPFVEVEETEEEPKNETETVKDIEHTVQKSESLEKIANHYKTTWKRIFDKNTQLENPDQINPGDVLKIPDADENIEQRELPTPAPVVAPATTTRTATTSSSATPATAPAQTTSRGSSAGNRYVAGYCTWYVKNMRPDMPNNLGNAYSWVSRAQAQGMATGSTPRAGAVGQRGNHVVYVQSVNSDGTVTISEMNHKGLYVRTVRTLPANYFTYIY